MGLALVLYNGSSCKSLDQDLFKKKSRKATSPESCKRGDADLWEVSPVQLVTPKYFHTTPGKTVENKEGFKGAAAGWGRVP